MLRKIKSPEKKTSRFFDKNKQRQNNLIPVPTKLLFS